jgi:4-hydroxybenzoate polyprenyltransferase
VNRPLALFLLKAARPGFWLTSIWFYLLPLAQRDELLSSHRFWVGLLYVSFPLGLFIYGWNDYVDAETDRLNPRKDSYLFGARGSDEQLRALPWWIFVAQLPFVALFSLWIGPGKTALFFAALTITTGLYNGPAGGAKNRPGLDLLNQVGYLLVFVISSWINAVPFLPWYSWIFGTLFAMHSHLFGQLMDIEPDAEAGRRTTAIVLGRKPAKWLLAAVMGFEAALVFYATRDPWIPLVLAGGMAWFVADVCWLWRERPYSNLQERVFFLGWNAAAIITAPLVWQSGTFSAAG